MAIISKLSSIVAQGSKVTCWRPTKHAKVVVKQQRYKSLVAGMLVVTTFATAHPAVAQGDLFSGRQQELQSLQRKRQDQMDAYIKKMRAMDDDDEDELPKRRPPREPKPSVSESAPEDSRQSQLADRVSKFKALGEQPAPAPPAPVKSAEPEVTAEQLRQQQLAEKVKKMQALADAEKEEEAPAAAEPVVATKETTDDKAQEQEPAAPTSEAPIQEVASVVESESQ